MQKVKREAAKEGAEGGGMVDEFPKKPTLAPSKYLLDLFRNRKEPDFRQEYMAEYPEYRECPLCKGGRSFQGKRCGGCDGKGYYEEKQDTKKGK